MTSKSIKPGQVVRDQRSRLANVRVLVADRDARTASLVHSVLFSFGFSLIDLATSGNQALEALRNHKFDLIITEWNLAPVDGVQLVKAIRAAKSDQRLKRDIPIIMLTAKADMNAVQAARDAGITEFMVKPFSARTLSNRLVQVIDNPRVFVDAPGYVGPCRRRRDGIPPAEGDRRGPKVKVHMAAPKSEVVAHDILPPNKDLKQVIGEDVSARDIFTENLIAEAQLELQKKEDQFIGWASDDIMQLEQAYAALVKHPSSVEAREKLWGAAYSIKGQAGIFGYDLGTEVGGMLVDYLANQPELKEESLLVVRKHIDTIAVIFNQKIKEAGREIGEELIDSLRKLTEKLG